MSHILSKGFMQMDTVVFDLDGTLADTSADLIAAANACFMALGHGQMLDPKQDAQTAFGGGRAMLRLGFARLGYEDVEAPAMRYYPELLAHYEQHIDRSTRLYDGAVEAIGVLRQNGMATAICTNKPVYLAQRLVGRLGIAPLFDALIGAGSLPVSKPDPAPYHAAVQQAGGVVARSLLVGDTLTDRDTARAAHVPCILVGFGPEGAGVKDLNPDAILNHYRDLPQLVAGLLG